MTPSLRPSPATLVSPADVGAFIGRLRSLLADFAKVLKAESDLVADVRLREAGLLESQKSALARAYTAELDILKANGAIIRRHGGAALDALKAENAAFQATLERNMAVLATSHAVAESIIRIAAREAEIARKPSVYGADGRQTVAPQRVTAPVAVSRSL